MAVCRVVVVQECKSYLGVFRCSASASVPSLDSLTESVSSLNHSENSLIPKEWDVFISHAHEDKDDIVRPLAHALRQHDLRVWFDEFELRIGDSLRRKIDQGIARSAFGVVVLSTAFFAKNWAQYELDGLRNTQRRWIAGPAPSVAQAHKRPKSWPTARR